MTKKYILIVDDSERWLNQMKDELSGLGYELLLAHNPRKAVRFLEKHSSEIALVACDNQMVIGDRTNPDAGLDILSEMRFQDDERATMPFILFTSEVSAWQRERAKENNAEVLIKNYSVSGALLEKAKEVLKMSE